jgi:hypothetical protein
MITGRHFHLDILGTMALAFIVTMITVSAQSIRVSLANPVKSLRTE